MELIDAIKALPKAEHHVHLLGSIKPATLMKAITDTGVNSPYESVEDIERAFEFQNFAHFISVYKQIIDLVTEERYFEPMTYELLESSKECNVKYVEMSLSAPDHTLQGLGFELMMKAIERDIRRGQSDFGVKADVRIDIVRSYGLESAMESLDMIENRPEGIVSIDISVEKGVSRDWFRCDPYFRALVALICVETLPAVLTVHESFTVYRFSRIDISRSAVRATQSELVEPI